MFFNQEMCWDKQMQCLILFEDLQEPVRDGYKFQLGTTYANSYRKERFLYAINVLGKETNGSD